MAEQPTPTVVMQAGQKRQSSAVRKIATTILIIILIILGFYGFFWATSDTGRQALASFWTTAKTDYNPFNILIELAKETGSEAGRIYGTEQNVTAEDVGIKFREFKAIGGEIIPSGTLVAFRYNIDVGGGVNDVTPKLECTVKDTAVGQSIEEQIIEGNTKKFIPEEIKISTDNELSYSNIVCQFKTNKLSEDRVVVAEGKLSFPFQQRNSLRVYFTRDIITGKEFFKKEGIQETLPIRAKYNNEPIAVGIGVNNEIQPVVIGENQFPSVGVSLTNKWDGRVTEIKEMNLILPKGVEIDKERSPTYLLCPFGNPISTGTDFVKYSSDEFYLKQIPEFGKGVGKTLQTAQTFFCWLKIDENILEDKPHVKKEYTVDVTYNYEFQPRTETITLKAIQELKQEEQKEQTNIT